MDRSSFQTEAPVAQITRNHPFTSRRRHLPCPVLNFFAYCGTLDLLGTPGESRRRKAAGPRFIPSKTAGLQNLVTRAPVALKVQHFCGHWCLEVDAMIPRSFCTRRPSFVRLAGLLLVVLLIP